MKHPQSSSLLTALTPLVRPAPAPPKGRPAPPKTPAKHGFTASTFAVAGAEELDAVANLTADLVSVYQPLDAQDLFAVERIALAQHALLRAARLEAGLFTCAVNQALDKNANSLDPASAEMTGALADGFRRMVGESSDVWKLFLRYQAQAQRNYRFAIEEFERLKPSGRKYQTNRFEGQTRIPSAT
ncbi:MAG: hypothetical protein ACLQU1_23170 [Bryobacteraceae bacterium]